MTDIAISTVNDPAEERSGEGPASEIRLGVLDSYIGFHLRLAQNASFRAVRERSGSHELRPGWFAVLSIIGDNPGISPVEVSRAAGRDKSTLTPVLHDLFKRRYLEKEPRPGDRRSYRLRLTEAGRAHLDVIAAHAAAHERLLDSIAGPRKAELIAVLRRITEELS
jgi:DNA-binding MarR family transcriptional regulator